MIARTLLDVLSRRIDPYVGTTIWDIGEWDICCILDGCRVDAFSEYYPSGESYWSVASTSQDWIPRTFGDRDVSDVAYVTGNPYSTRLDTDRFAAFHAEPVRDVGDVETVPPRALTHRAIDIWRRREEFGVDRMVVHFMQPHVPFRDRPEWFEDVAGSDEWGSRIWQAVGEDIAPDAWMTAYEENLRWAIYEGVLRLAYNTNARIDVTADHGNASGEWGYSGHPEGCLHPAVRRVPHLQLMGTDLGGIDPADPEPAGYDRDEQLAALGYA